MSFLNAHIARHRLCSALAAAVVAGNALVVILGWAISNASLKSTIPGLVAMNPLTAITFLLAAVALASSSRPYATWSHRVSLCCGGVIALLGLVRVMAYLFAWDLELDRMLFAGSLGENRMAPNTALYFVLIGLALTVVNLEPPRARKAAEVLAMLVAAGSLLALIGYAFGTEGLYGFASFIPMALNTAGLFVLVSLGILCLHPDSGVLGVFTSKAAGGMMARRLLPIAILLPLVLGWLRMQGENARLYDTEFGVALLVCLTMILFLMAVWWTARALNLTDAQRALAQQQLQYAHDELELRVQERTMELADANRDLAQKNQENEMFIYSVSHDLRSPLVNLQGFSNELTIVCEDAARLFDAPEIPDAVRARGKVLLGEEMAEPIHFIQTAVTRLSTIIDALLRLSRVGRVELKPQEVDMQATVMRIVESMAATIGGLDATVTVRELPPAWSDAPAMEQVFANLLGNALKYLDPRRKGVIEIGYVSDGDSTISTSRRMNKYYVKDNGLGIPAAHQVKIFQIFQRAHPEVAQGEGMGLAIVKRVVERLGGQVYVESTSGSGSTFLVELPAEPAASSAGRCGSGPGSRQERGTRDGMRGFNDSFSRGRPGACAPGATELATSGHRQ